MDSDQPNPAREWPQHTTVQLSGEGPPAPAVRRAIGEGIEIVRRCEEAGLIMQMGYETRCMAGIRHIKRLLDEGRMGRAVALEVNWSHDLGLRLTPQDWNYHEANCPGGPIMQLGIHHVFNALNLLGPIVTATTKATSLAVQAIGLSLRVSCI